jgi:hypothetical protein
MGKRERRKKKIFSIICVALAIVMGLGPLLTLIYYLVS